MTTVLPSSRHSRTIRATCSAEDHLPSSTTRRSFAFELEIPLRAGLKLTQSGELSSLPLLEIGNDLADDMIQLIGRFRGGNTGLFGQTIGQIELFHPDSC